MNKKEPLKTSLSKKIKENIVTEYVGLEEDNKIVDLFRDNKKRLFDLLLVHPYFNKQVKKIRSLYDIPKKGFTTGKEIYQWEHPIKDRKKNFNKEIDKLVSDFSFPFIYKKAVWYLFYDFITNSEWENRDVIKDREVIKALPIFSIVKTDSDREINKYLINPSSKYIEIFDWTTKRDINKALKIINRNKKKEKSLFKISKVEDCSKKIWKMSQEGLKDKEISEKMSSFLVGKNNERRVIDRIDVSIYKKRYKDVLSSLREIK